MTRKISFILNNFIPKSLIRTPSSNAGFYIHIDITNNFDWINEWINDTCGVPGSSETLSSKDFLFCVGVLAELLGVLEDFSGVFDLDLFEVGDLVGVLDLDLLEGVLEDFTSFELTSIVSCAFLEANLFASEGEESGRCFFVLWGENEVASRVLAKALK